MKALQEKIVKKRLWTNNLILTVDFNFYDTDADLVALVEAQGFQDPPPLQGLDTNVSQTEIYDRMFYRENKYFKIFQDTENPKGGVFDFFKYVYSERDASNYHDKMRENKRDPSTLVSDEDFRKYYLNYWRRTQISDHYPIWIEMSINSTGEFLADKLKQYQEA